MKDYKDDLTPANERTSPVPCCICGGDGIIWRKDGLLCYACDAASRPLTLTPDDLARAVRAGAVTTETMMQIARRRR